VSGFIICIFILLAISTAISVDPWRPLQWGHPKSFRLSQLCMVWSSWLLWWSLAPCHTALYVNQLTPSCVLPQTHGTNLMSQSHTHCSMQFSSAGVMLSISVCVGCFSSIIIVNFFIIVSTHSEPVWLSFEEYFNFYCPCMQWTSLGSKITLLTAPYWLSLYGPKKERRL